MNARSGNYRAVLRSLAPKLLGGEAFLLNVRKVLFCLKKGWGCTASGKKKKLQ